MARIIRKDTKTNTDKYIKIITDNHIKESQNYEYPGDPSTEFDYVTGHAELFSGNTAVICHYDHKNIKRDNALYTYTWGAGFNWIIPPEQSYDGHYHNYVDFCPLFLRKKYNRNSFEIRELFTVDDFMKYKYCTFMFTTYVVKDELGSYSVPDGVLILAHGIIKDGKTIAFGTDEMKEFDETLKDFKETCVNEQPDETDTDGGCSLSE